MLSHAPGLPVQTDGTEWPRMKIAIRLGPKKSVLSQDKQIRLLKEMNWLNNTGKVKVHGSSTEEQGKMGN
jgi:hypothetical protein